MDIVVGVRVWDDGEGGMQHSQYIYVKRILIFWAIE